MNFLFKKEVTHYVRVEADSLEQANEKVSDVEVIDDDVNTAENDWRFDSIVD